MSAASGTRSLFGLSAAQFADGTPAIAQDKTMIGLQLMIIFTIDLSVGF